MRASSSYPGMPSPMPGSTTGSSTRLTSLSRPFRLPRSCGTSGASSWACPEPSSRAALRPEEAGPLAGGTWCGSTCRTPSSAPRWGAPPVPPGVRGPAHRLVPTWSQLGPNLVPHRNQAQSEHGRLRSAHQPVILNRADVCFLRSQRSENRPGSEQCAIIPTCRRMSWGPN